MKQKYNTDKAPVPAGPYSQAVRAGEYLFLAGQGAVDAATGVMANTVEEQTRQVLTNLKYILEEAGAGMNDVVKVTAHLADLKYFEAFNGVYKEFFQDPYPVRTTVGSQLSPGLLVEIDVIAWVK